MTTTQFGELVSSAVATSENVVEMIASIPNQVVDAAKKAFGPPCLSPMKTWISAEIWDAIKTVTPPWRTLWSA